MGLMMHVHAYGVHSGYISEDMGFHDLHHEKFNVNYGLTGTLDQLYGCFQIRDESVGQKSFIDNLEELVIQCFCAVSDAHEKRKLTGRKPAGNERMASEVARQAKMTVESAFN